MPNTAGCADCRLRMKSTCATPPLVSVIICSHNRRDLVPRAIDSALAQTSVDLEVIVVDDASTDGTSEALRKRFGDRIHLITLETNSRVAAATNIGFRASSGRYIALLGDDDYWADQDKISKQLAEFEAADSSLGVAGTWWTEAHSSGDMIRKEPLEPANWRVELLKGGSVICGSTPLIDREAWTRAGGLDEQLPRGTDSDLFRRIILQGFAGRILYEQTTVVDVGHGLTRMTANRGLKEGRKVAFVHAYLLWKYRRQYLQHPGALYTRAKSLLLGFAAVVVRTFIPHKST